MHAEILIEDSSGAALLEFLLPKIFGEFSDPHTWRIHAYRGIGRIPKNLSGQADPSKRILLDQLPRILRGYGKSPGIDVVIVVADTDTRSCADFLSELQTVADACNPKPNVLFRLAIEEIEAWYFGDRAAVISAYPKAKIDALNRYAQDSVCGTWEMLADALYPGGSDAIRRAGWPLPGQVKHEWAEKIGPQMDPARNISPSFVKFREGLGRLI
ncbi:MAG: hypothetical protein JSR98_21975 [Proteobacteria bacterium]|nr:hypothetical protein [Pseudomonadota bacterium]